MNEMTSEQWDGQWADGVDYGQGWWGDWGYEWDYYDTPSYPDAHTDPSSQDVSAEAEQP